MALRANLHLVATGSDGTGTAAARLNHLGGGTAGGDHGFGQAKIGDDNAIPLFIEQNIGGFDVAVQHALPVA